MSSTRDSLLAAIRADMEDDLPRLVYADWLEENGHPRRASFIRKQCELARTPDTESRYFDLKWDLAANPPDAAWANELPPKLRKVRHDFRRGFVDTVDLTAKKFLADGGELFQTGAVRQLALSSAKNHIAELKRCAAFAGAFVLNLNGNKFGEADGAQFIAECPHLARMTGLNLGGTGLGVAGAERLARTEHLAGLRHLRVNGANLRDAGVENLAESPHLAGLTELDISGCNSGPRSLRAIAENLKRLKSLTFVANRLDDRAADVLLDPDAFPELVDFHITSGYRDNLFPALTEFVRTPLFRRLKKLSIDAEEVPASLWGGLPDDFEPGLSLTFHATHAETNARLAASPVVARCSRLLIWVSDSGGDVMRALAANPAAANLRGLTVRGAGNHGDDSRAALGAVAASEHLSGLVDFQFHGAIDDDDLKLVGRANFAGNLRRIGLEYHGLSPAGLTWLAKPESFPNVIHLAVYRPGVEHKYPMEAKALAERFGIGFGWSW